jgi:hypothetical protein
MTFTVHDGSDGVEMLSGEDVLDEIYDLIAARLPQMAIDDPVRACLMRLAPVLGSSVGRPPVRLLGPEVA